MFRDAHGERPIVDRAEQGLEVVSNHLVQRRALGLMAAIDADFAFRHANPPTVEGEGASVASVWSFWGSLLFGTSAVRLGRYPLPGHGGPKGTKTKDEASRSAATSRTHKIPSTFPNSRLDTCAEKIQTKAKTVLLKPAEQNAGLEIPTRAGHTESPSVSRG